jgi:hypothetical protein
MREILPGIHHWTAHHDGIGARVSSYFVEPAGVLIDPMVPEDGLDAFTGLTKPQQVVLTTGLHTRHADRFADAFGALIRFSSEGGERIGGALEGEVYNEHEDIAPGIRAIQIGVLCPDEYALHIAHAGGAIAVADGLTRYGDSVGFFSDDLLGDDPQEVKDGLKQQYGTVLEREWEHLLFAHGEPILRHGKTVLRDFVTSPVGHEEFGQSL